MPASALRVDFGPGAPPPFRLDRSSVARIPLSAVEHPPIPARFFPSMAKPKDRLSVHLGLFLFTIVTTTLVGAGHYLGFLSDFTRVPVMSAWAQLAGGLYYSLSVLAILGIHELGHYYACRYYRVDASMPYFIPVPPPLPVMTGTLGAFIKIREPIREKKVLFDIGIAGPLAGFVIAVPLLFLGIAWSHVVPVPKNFQGDLVNLGESLLFKLATWMIWGNIPDTQTLNMHPIALAAWFGLLATTFNLFPIGQLDGGHISYAVFGRHSTRITYGALVIAIGLVFVSMSWFLWTVLITAMLYFFGPHHPPVADEDVPLDRGRVILAVVALLVFILCFMPAPLSMIMPTGK